MAKLLLVGIHSFLAALVDDALGVNHSDVLALHAHADVVFGASDAGCASAIDHDFDLVHALACQLHRIRQGRAGDDRGAVLIVVEDGDLHRLLQRLFDVEAFRRLDVFQVDAAESGLQQAGRS